MTSFHSAPAADCGQTSSGEGTTPHRPVPTTHPCRARGPRPSRVVVRNSLEGIGKGVQFADGGTRRAAAALTERPVPGQIQPRTRCARRGGSPDTRRGSVGPHSRAPPAAYSNRWYQRPARLSVRPPPAVCRRVRGCRRGRRMWRWRLSSTAPCRNALSTALSRSYHPQAGTSRRGKHGARASTRPLRPGTARRMGPGASVPWFSLYGPTASCDSRSSSSLYKRVHALGVIRPTRPRSSLATRQSPLSTRSTTH
jgi:hypothetical protein